MKLKEYMDNLNKLVKDNPEAKEFDVISAIDDEGNGYNLVFFHPTLGVYDGDEFNTDVDPKKFNAICIN